MPSKVKIHSALALVSLIYGANYTVAKIVMPEYLLPFGFIVLRVSVATLLFWLIANLSEKEPIDKKDLVLFFLCGLFGVATNQMLFFKGLSLTTPINASVIMTTSPIAVMIVAYIMGKERLTILKIVGVSIGAIGAFMLITKDSTSLEEGGFLGNILVLLNGTSYAVYLVIVKPLMAKYNAITVIKWVFLFGFILVIPFGYDEFVNASWGNLPYIAWFSIGYVIFMATLLVYLLNIWSLKFVNSSVVGIYIYLQPVFASLVAILVRGDRLDLFTVLYSMVIMIGVYLVSKKSPAA